MSVVVGVRRRHTAAVAAVVLALPLLGACQSAGAMGDRDGEGGQSRPDASATPPTPVRLSTNLAKPRQVPVNKVVRIDAEHGRLRSVRVTSPEGRLAGRVCGDEWVSQGRLEPGLTYRVVAVTERADDGKVATRRTRFHTEELPLDRQTYPSVSPLQGETVGVGMPVIVTFDVPVRDKKTFEKHMSVTSSPAQKGSWHWMSDQEAHWRPARYWQAGTDVHVDVDVNSLPAGAGIYGQESRSVDFRVGDAVVSRVDAQAHQMKTYINGALAKTSPITLGKEGFTTRSGVKVIIEKFDTKRMNSETIGISQGDPEAYDLDDVQWAMRVTYSGEFVHAAPWSVGSQGYDNVSHGCTGMSPSDAKWLYDRSKRGDVVEYTGTGRPMSLTNGYGDWNVSFADYRQGSALR